MKTISFAIWYILILWFHNHNFTNKLLDFNSNVDWAAFDESGVDVFGAYPHVTVSRRTRPGEVSQRTRYENPQVITQWVYFRGHSSGATCKIYERINSRTIQYSNMIWALSMREWVVVGKRALSECVTNIREKKENTSEYIHSNEWAHGERNMRKRFARVCVHIVGDGIVLVSKYILPLVLGIRSCIITHRRQNATECQSVSRATIHRHRCRNISICKSSHKKTFWISVSVCARARSFSFTIFFACTPSPRTTTIDEIQRQATCNVIYLARNEIYTTGTPCETK